MLKNNFIKSWLLLLCMIVGVGSAWGQASVETTLWSENWTGGTTGATPSAYTFEGTTVYGGATLTYAQSVANTKLYAETLAGGVSPELLLAKNNGTWTISNIPTGQATEMTLSFVSNKTSFAISSTTEGIAISGSGTSWTITADNVAVFDLEFKNTSSANARIDNILLVVKTAGASASSLASIALSGDYPTSFYQNDAFSYEGMTVTATYDDESTRNVTASATFSGYNMNETGNQTVIVSYTEGGVTKTAEYGITINERPKYTVTFGDGGSVTQETAGAEVTLPSRDDVSSYTFAGWSETNIESETTEAPTIIPAGSYTPTANITLYPVYTKTEGGGGTQNKSASVIISEYASDNGWNNATAYQPLIMDANISVGGTVSGNNFKYYTSDNSWRFYKDGSFTVSASSGTTITSITFTFASGGAMSYNEESVTSNTAVDINAASADFSVSATTKITAISVDYTIAGGGTTYYWSAPVAAAVERPEIVVAENPFQFSTTATITCETEGATIYYSYDNESWTAYTEELAITATTTIYAKAVKDANESTVASVTATKNLAEITVTIDATGITNTNVYEGTEAGSLAATVTYNEVAVEGAVVTWSGNNDEVATINAETGVVTLVGAGTVTFTATYAGNEDYAENTATYVMTVTNTDPNAPGTENNPYTVAQAIEATPASGTSANVYIRGIVSAFYASDIMSDGSNYRYYISDNGTTTGQLLVYKGKGEGNVAFTSADDLLIGDEVVILGGLTTYKGEAEVAANNYIFSLNRIEKYAINFAASPAAAGTVEALDGETNVVASGDKFVENTALTVSATANTGYTFANWTAEGVTLSEVEAAKATLDITMPARDVTLTANFTVNTYALSITSANGTVAVTVNGEEWNGTDEIAYGATVELTATANTDWAFTSWTVEGVTLDNDTENPVTFTMPANAVMIEANYADASASYTVLYSVAGVENEVERKHGAALNLETPGPVNGMAFAGWSTTADATAPVFVANDATVTDDMILFAVFTAQAGTNAYKLVEADQADWRGDYLIAYNDNTFADGRIGGKDADGSIGKLNVYASPEPGDFNGNEIKASWGDIYYVTLEAINDADLSKGYVLKTQDGKYNYHTANSNGLSATEYKETAANYSLSVTFNSSSDIEIAISAGAVFHYNTGGYFRFYKDGSQSAVYLYKKVSSDPVYSLGLPSVVTIKADADYAAFSATQPVSFYETGVTVYTATVMNNGNSCYVHLDEVADGIVPANTGVILYKEVAENANISAAAVKCEKNSLDNNDLLVSDGTTVGNGSIYALANKTQGVGFYRVKADLAVPAGKPYLVIPSEEAGAREFFGFNEEGGTPTGISSMHNAEFIMHNNEVYNLNGQRVETLKKGGLYIQNGKKVIVNK